MPWRTSLWPEAVLPRQQKIILIHRWCQWKMSCSPKQTITIFNDGLNGTDVCRFFGGFSKSMTKDVNYKASKLMAHTYKTYKNNRCDLYRTWKDVLDFCSGFYWRESHWICPRSILEYPPPRKSKAWFGEADSKNSLYYPCRKLT